VNRTVLVRDPILRSYMALPKAVRACHDLIKERMEEYEDFELATVMKIVQINENEPFQPNRKRKASEHGEVHDALAEFEQLKRRRTKDSRFIVACKEKSTKLSYKISALVRRDEENVERQKEMLAGLIAEQKNKWLLHVPLIIRDN
jgi:hypothetical protein